MSEIVYMNRNSTGRFTMDLLLKATPTCLAPEDIHAFQRYNFATVVFRP